MGAMRSSLFFESRGETGTVGPTPRRDSKRDSPKGSRGPGVVPGRRVERDPVGSGGLLRLVFFKEGLPCYIKKESFPQV